MWQYLIKSFLIFSFYLNIHPTWAENNTQHTTTIADQLRKQYYKYKGISEEFYHKYIGPFSFHLKWQVGLTAGIHRNQEQSIIEEIDDQAGATSRQTSFDLVSFYVHPERQKWMSGISLHATSISVYSQNTDLQIDHYMAAFSFVYFYNQFKQGLYWRGDGGIIWHTFDVSGEHYDIDGEDPGLGIKLGIGYALSIKAKPAITLEAFYFAPYTHESLGHTATIAIGFIL